MGAKEKKTRVSAGNRRRVQARKERKDAFNEAKKQVFLDHLAKCCTVATSAAAAGVSVNTVNSHRRTDPIFDQQCREALDLGYDNLEASALAEAAAGGHYTPGPDSDAPGPRKLDREMTLHLLSLRRKPMGQRTGRAGREPRRVTEKELNDSILAKLEVLDRRLKLTRSEVRKLKSPGEVPAAGNGAAAGGRNGDGR